MNDFFPVICVETTDNGYRKVKKGNQYWALQLDYPTMSQTYCIYVSERKNREDYIGNFEHKRFITIAEWREKQIKSVIDD